MQVVGGWVAVERGFIDKAVSLVIWHSATGVRPLCWPATQHARYCVEPVEAARRLVRPALVARQCGTPVVRRPDHVAEIQGGDRRRALYEPTQRLTRSQRPVDGEDGPEWDHGNHWGRQQPADCFSPSRVTIVVVRQVNTLDAREQQHKLHRTPQWQRPLLLLSFKLLLLF